jgi:hypothetical protein
LLLVNEALIPPDDLRGLSEDQIEACRTEYNVLSTLSNAGHEVRVLGIGDKIGELRRVIRDWRPGITFNLLEEFSGIATDMWDYPGHPSHLADATDGGAAYLAMVKKNLEFTKDLGITLFRVDTVQAPDILEKGVDKNQAMDRVVKTWQQVCRMAADMGINVTWEFELEAGKSRTLTYEVSFYTR